MDYLSFWLIILFTVTQHRLRQWKRTGGIPAARSSRDVHAVVGGRISFGYFEYRVEEEGWNVILKQRQNASLIFRVLAVETSKDNHKIWDVNV